MGRFLFLKRDNRKDIAFAAQKENIFGVSFWIGYCFLSPFSTFLLLLLYRNLPNVMDLFNFFSCSFYNSFINRSPSAWVAARKEECYRIEQIGGEGERDQ